MGGKRRDQTFVNPSFLLYDFAAKPKHLYYYHHDSARLHDHDLIHCVSVRASDKKATISCDFENTTPNLKNTSTTDFNCFNLRIISHDESIDIETPAGGGGGSHGELG